MYVFIRIFAEQNMLYTIVLFLYVTLFACHLLSPFEARKGIVTVSASSFFYLSAFVSLIFHIHYKTDTDKENLVLSVIFTVTILVKLLHIIWCYAPSFIVCRSEWVSLCLDLWKKSILHRNVV